MADRYFKKSKDKFKVGYSSKIFKYDFRTHKIEDLENEIEKLEEELKDK